jgi:hypothetical protein
MLAVLMILPLAAAENETIITYNGSNINYTNFTGANLTLNNTGGSWLPNLTMPNLTMPNLSNITKNLNATNLTTGVQPVDDVTKFLVTASPFLLLLLGVGILLLAGFARLIGIILIALALIRILWMMMGW